MASMIIGAANEIPGTNYCKVLLDVNPGEAAQSSKLKVSSFQGLGLESALLLIRHTLALECSRSKANKMRIDKCFLIFNFRN